MNRRVFLSRLLATPTLPFLGKLLETTPIIPYVMGVDWGKNKDWTAIGQMQRESYWRIYRTEAGETTFKIIAVIPNGWNSYTDTSTDEQLRSSSGTYFTYDFIPNRSR